MIFMTIIGLSDHDDLGGAQSGGANLVDDARRLWKITRAGTARVMKHRRFGKFYKSTSDDLWWSKDTAGHGGSAWKVFEETGEGLQWKHDADQYGDFIEGKHKGSTGLFIPWKDLSGAKF